MSPAPTTERLQSIQRLVADQLGDKAADFEANALRDSRRSVVSTPSRMSGTSNRLWTCRTGPGAYRAQFACEIAEEAAVGGHIEPMTLASASSARLDPLRRRRL